MGSRDRIEDLLRRAHQGVAWHGPCFDDAVQGLNARQAAHKAIATSHSIWELVLHIAAWENMALRSLSGEVVKDLTPEEDWPPVPELTDQNWAATLALVNQLLQELLDQIGFLADDRLDEKVPGKHYTVEFLLHGVVQHTLYHVGQIMLLRKVAG